MNNEINSIINNTSKYLSKNELRRKELLNTQNKIKNDNKMLNKMSKFIDM